MKIIKPEELAANAVSSFQQGKYDKAAGEFSVARSSYLALGQQVKAAEMANSQSVAKLQFGEPQTAFDLLQGTEIVFEESNEPLLKAMSVGNLAACLDALNKSTEAEFEYKRCAKLLKELGEDQLYAQTMKSLSALQLKSGRQLEALANMQTGFDEIKRPNFRQRLLKKLLNLPSKFQKR